MMCSKSICIKLALEIEFILILQVISDIEKNIMTIQLTQIICTIQHYNYAPKFFFYHVNFYVT
jgi:hypothetical protein